LERQFSVKLVVQDLLAVESKQDSLDHRDSAGEGPLILTPVLHSYFLCSRRSFNPSTSASLDLTSFESPAWSGNPAAGKTLSVVFLWVMLRVFLPGPTLIVALPVLLQRQPSPARGDKWSRAPA
jgi:hypothetical protein